MKYGTVIRLLTAICVVIIQLTGCSPDTEDMKRSLADIPIRIVAEMNKGTGASRMTKASVRSGGNGRRTISVRRNTRKPSNMSYSSLIRTSGPLRRKSFSTSPHCATSFWRTPSSRSGNRIRAITSIVFPITDWMSFTVIGFLS